MIKIDMYYSILGAFSYLYLVSVNEYSQNPIVDFLEYLQKIVFNIIHNSLPLNSILNKLVQLFKFRNS